MGTGQRRVQLDRRFGIGARASLVMPIEPVDAALQISCRSRFRVLDRGDVAVGHDIIQVRDELVAGRSLDQLRLEHAGEGAPLHRLGRRPQYPHPVPAKGRAIARPAQLLRPSAHRRVVRGQAVGHINDVADPHIFRLHQRRQPTVERRALQVLLAPHDRYRRPITEQVDRLAVAQDAVMVERERIQRRVPADLKRRVVEPLRRGDAVDSDEIIGVAFRSKADLRIVQQRHRRRTFGRGRGGRDGGGQHPCLGRGDQWPAGAHQWYRNWCRQRRNGPSAHQRCDDREGQETHTALG